MNNRIVFKVWGRHALFTDPITKLGGEKCSYHIPTYEALKGIACSIYWKPTLTWFIDRVRVMRPIRTEAKNVKPLNFSGGNTLAIYTYLHEVEYQVEAHFEWNLQRPDLAPDRIDGKHFSVLTRMLEKGGRRDIFLGTRECQGYVAPCLFGEGDGAFDAAGEVAYGLMFHGFDYPDTSGRDELVSRFWYPVMRNGVIEFTHPDQCGIRKLVRSMRAEAPATVGLNDEELWT